MTPFERKLLKMVNEEMRRLLDDPHEAQGLANGEDYKIDFSAAKLTTIDISNEKFDSLTINLPPVPDDYDLKLVGNVLTIKHNPA